MASRIAVLVLLVACAGLAAGQQIRSYTRQELYPGQICGDDGAPWEKLMVGECPQGYNGIRNWAKARGLLTPNNPQANLAGGAGFVAQRTWPYCNACKDGQMCFEFKPGVAKCMVPADASKGQTFLKEGDVCLDFSNGNKKWTPKEVNPALFGKSCEWPMFSCNWDAKANNGRYTCQRLRASATAEPVVKCYRAGGSRWWGGSDQWYAWHNGKFVPCGGPNPDYKSCENFPSCAAYKPWTWTE